MARLGPAVLKKLIWLWKCTGWSGSSVGAHVTFWFCKNDWLLLWSHAHLIACLFKTKGSAVAQWLSAWLETEGQRVRASPASLRCCPWARQIYPSLVQVQPRKTRPCITERLLMGRKESNQTKKIFKTKWPENSTITDQIGDKFWNRLYWF